MTLLCVAIFVKTAEQARRDSLLAAEHGADLVELRIDALTEPIAVDGLPLPCIVTCRPDWEGGQSELAEVDRIELLKKQALLEPKYIDLELQTLRGDPNLEYAIRRPLIVSSHDFRGRPDRLHNLIVEMNESGGAANKVVWTARSIRDNIEAFEILHTALKPTIALCMGEAGLISRILAGKFKAFLTFASLGRGAGTADGQVPIGEMKRLYHWDSIGPGTKVYGVVGSPVGHSMSPAIHNAAFDELGHDGVYLPLLVHEGYESFKAFMESFLAFEPLDLSGLSVTIPHKENALRYLREKGAEVEALAERIGAVNTVIIERTPAGPKLRGINTDYGAILDTVTAALTITRQDLAGYRVGVIGAGGTGRTAVAALAHCGATVVVYNRTRERADALAAEFNGHSGHVVAAPIEKLCDSCCQIFINTTSVGMSPNVDASPLGERPPKFSPETLVFDTVYNPMHTRLLRDAQAAGARTVGGVEMFVRQAVAQFEAWTGKQAPAASMRRVVEERLSPGSGGVPPAF